MDKEEYIEVASQLMISQVVVERIYEILNIGFSLNYSLSKVLSEQIADDQKNLSRPKNLRKEEWKKANFNSVVKARNIYFDGLPSVMEIIPNEQRVFLDVTNLYNSYLAELHENLPEYSFGELSKIFNSNIIYDPRLQILFSKYVFISLNEEESKKYQDFFMVYRDYVENKNKSKVLYVFQDLTQKLESDFTEQGYRSLTHGRTDEDNIFSIESSEISGLYDDAISKWKEISKESDKNFSILEKISKTNIKSHGETFKKLEAEYNVTEDEYYRLCYYGFIAEKLIDKILILKDRVKFSKKEYRTKYYQLTEKVINLSYGIMPTSAKKMKIKDVYIHRDELEELYELAKFVMPESKYIKIIEELLNSKNSQMN